MHSPEQAEAQSARWFRVDEDFDREIAHRFGSLPLRARAGELDDWGDSPRAALALAIVLDQLPRNLFRGQARAFEFDADARRVARAALHSGHDAELQPLEAVFLYLPFEHSEDLADQSRSVALFAQLQARVPASVLPMYERFSDYAGRHHEVIARFGRFPHRNRSLGRAATPEELAYLEAGGEAF